MRSALTTANPIALLFALVGALALASAAVAADKSKPINADRAGLALDGYDPVSYFDGGKPQKGKADLTTTWQGATWRFATAEHRDRFRAKPEAFAPQFGGYCAYAVSEGYTYDADPRMWKIVDGKLYLNYNDKAQKLWLEDVPGRIAKGNSNWPTLHTGQN